MTSTIEKRAFRLDAAALSTVIFRQAGTLERAIAEATQNAADAGATGVQVEVTDDQIVVRDDGVGFAERDDVIRGFEAFGRPHDGDEVKEFGRFRMGRGQLFAFGPNRWRSRAFQMTVDVRQGEALTYTLEDNLPDRPGCEIVISRRADASRFRLPPGKLRDVLKWVTLPVTLNDLSVTTDRGSVPWDVDTADGLVRLTGGDTAAVYDRGYLVSSDTVQVGLGRVLVSRRPLSLNFARNEVMPDCPVYLSLQAEAEPIALELMRRVASRTESAADRRRWRGLLTRDALEGLHLPVLETIDGRLWSASYLSQVVRYYSYRVFVLDRSASAAAKLRARMVMAAGQSVVLTGAVNGETVAAALSNTGVCPTVLSGDDAETGKAAAATETPHVVAGKLLPRPARSTLRRLSAAIRAVGKQTAGVDLYVNATRKWVRMATYAVRVVAAAGGPPVWCDGYRLLGVRTDWLAAMTPYRWTVVATVWARAGCCRAATVATEPMTLSAWRDHDQMGAWATVACDLVRYATEGVPDANPERPTDGD
jgi:hypothetical protein